MGCGIGDVVGGAIGDIVGCGIGDIVGGAIGDIVGCGIGDIVGGAIGDIYVLGGCNWSASTANVTVSSHIFQTGVG